MSDAPSSWFHCARCGTLFLAPVGADVERRCDSCGREPSLGVRLTAPAALPAAPADGSPERSEDHPSGGRSHGTRRRKRSYLMVKLIGGWTLFMAVLIVLANLYWKNPEDREASDWTGRAAAGSLADADVILLREAAEGAGASLMGFLEAGAGEGASQHVLDPVRAASRMARYYQLNSVTRIEPGSLEILANGLLQLPDGERAYEARWRTPDGRILDAVFRKQNQLWRLDWEHFVRYSDYPWSLFLAGSGPEEGEFRLLARERLLDHTGDKPELSMVFYGPRFGQPTEPGPPSPEFVVPRAGPMGRVLDAAFREARAGVAVFGSSMPSLDPEGLLRVRVRVKRSNQETARGSGRDFELVEVLACHWLEHEALGVDPDKASATDPAEESTPR